MATYIYETIPRRKGEQPTAFEVSQSMLDAPLTHDPHTGRPVRRIISGGLGVITGKRGFTSPAIPTTGSSARYSSGCCGTCHS